MQKEMCFDAGNMYLIHDKRQKVKKNGDYF